MTEPCAECGVRVSPDRFGLCPGCLLGAELPPAVVGGSYELGDALGRGGMGTVYRATDQRLGREVAIKFLPDELSGDEELERRFAREARALAMLSHPHVVTLYDFGQDGGQSWIVMELADGGSLAERIPVSAAEARRIAVEVCDGVGHAHARGIVHRDLKPENILFDGTGRAKVGDFGIARMEERGAGWTVTSEGHVAGTPHYVAPEALAGAAPDPRQDVYALGVLVYEMVTGTLPRGSFEPLPGSLDPVVRKALSRDPADRYGDAQEMGRALGGSAVSREAFELPPHERTFILATAGMWFVASVVSLLAFTVSVTPKEIAKEDVQPLIMVGLEELENGRYLCRARFEVWWTVGSFVMLVLACVAYGALRLRWTREGLEHPQPERRLRESCRVFRAGLISLGVYGLYLSLRASGADAVVRYIPILGGVIEAVVLLWFWIAVLESVRTSRSLAREPLLWLGLAFSVAPPAIELGIYVVTYTP